VSKRIGLPVTLKMRHDAHYVETLTSFSGASVGRMIPIDKIRPNPDQPRKNIGDIRELADSIRVKGVLEPLLVRFVPGDDAYYIISGERRYHASKAAGLHELPCIEKIADDAETLELALIENLQRKDLTPFEEADGLQRLASQFDYTHDDIAKKIGRARSSVTETLSLRLIPDSVRRVCAEKGIVSKSLLLQIARQPNEKKMREMLQRIVHGGLTRDEARHARQEEMQPAPRPQPFVFNYKPEDESFTLRLQFRKSQVSSEELAATLRAILRQLESGSLSTAAAAASSHPSGHSSGGSGFLPPSAA
jgi:ParB family transcriptional regulator, chromosome partitioning protein